MLHIGKSLCFAPENEPAPTGKIVFLKLSFIQKKHTNKDRSHYWLKNIYFQSSVLHIGKSLYFAPENEPAPREKKCVYKVIIRTKETQL